MKMSTVVHRLQFSAAGMPQTSCRLSLFFDFRWRNLDIDAIAAGIDVGRHDFHSGFEETVEQVLMELGVDAWHILGVTGEGVDFVLHVEIVKRCRHHKRLRMFLDTWRVCRCFFHDTLYELPGHIVADGDFGVNNEPVSLCGYREVGGLGAHEAGVLNGDDLVLAGTYAGDENGLLDDFAHGVTDLDIITDMKWTHIGHHHSGHHIADDGGGAAGEKCAR